MRLLTGLLLMDLLAIHAAPSSLFAGEADFSADKITFEIPLPLDKAALSTGPYLISGQILYGQKSLGSFYRIPRLHYPCPEAPCAAAVRAALTMREVGEAFVRNVIQNKCRMVFRTEFRNAETKQTVFRDIPVAITPQAAGLTLESASDLIRIENSAVVPKTRALTFDLMLLNPFPFPVRLTGVRVKAEPIRGLSSSTRSRSMKRFPPAKPSSP